MQTSTYMSQTCLKHKILFQGQQISKREIWTLFSEKIQNNPKTFVWAIAENMKKYDLVTDDFKSRDAVASRKVFSGEIVFGHSFILR